MIDSKSTGMTGAETGLTGALNKPGNSTEVKDKKRPSFKELPANYEKKGIAQKQEGQSSKVKDTKPSLKRQERSCFYLSQVSYASFDGPIAPWYYRYPYFYSSMDYSRCICNHITFNIFLYIQIMLHHKDQLLLAIIWSTKILIAARRMRRVQSKIQSIYS